MSSADPKRYVLPEIVFGRGAMDLVDSYVQGYGSRSVLVVSDPGVERAGWTSRVLRSIERAGAATILFDGVTPNPRAGEVAAGLELCRSKGCDLIIAVGGGSPMDCAKGIAVCAANGGSILDYEGIDRIPVPTLPLICVPTTAGSAADVSQFAIITDPARRIKIAVVSRRIVPDVALVDPEATETMDPELTAATGMDALSHAVEAYVSTGASPLTDLDALRAATLVQRALVRAWRDGRDAEARDMMAQACLFAGKAFSNASLGLVHAMAHALGGYADAPHGLCNALLLEAVAKANGPAAAPRYDDLARAMGEEPRRGDEPGAAFARAVARLRRDLGLGSTLAAVGLRAEDIPTLALNASRDPCMATNPRRLGVEEIGEIYAWAL
ncbi:MAG: iron-containing alcohol dehydrogenase [Spirochaetaceae bacterium]|nr:iron-containing alcohol dehydrogenase [Spirochaetaceae bacterium]